MVTPPRPIPKMNSLTSVGPKFLVSEIVGMLPGPFLRSVMVSGQFQTRRGGSVGELLVVVVINPAHAERVVESLICQSPRMMFSLRG